MNCDRCGRNDGIEFLFNIPVYPLDVEIAPLSGATADRVTTEIYEKVYQCAWCGAKKTIKE